jgi:F0F1-type ATP synthase assembly protein I
MQKNDNLNPLRQIAPYMGLGFQIAATVILMFFIGYWLDDEFQIKPILTIIFSLFGSFAAIYNFIKTTLELEKKKKDEDIEKRK